MLQKIADHIKTCLDRAAEAEDRASQTDNPNVKAQYAQLAKSWRHLARSYEFVESLDDFQREAATWSQHNTFPVDTQPLRRRGSDIYMWVFTIVGIAVVPSLRGSCSTSSAAVLAKADRMRPPTEAASQEPETYEGSQHEDHANAGYDVEHNVDAPIVHAVCRAMDGSGSIERELKRTNSGRARPRRGLEATDAATGGSER